MILSGTVLGFIGAGFLLLAAVVIAFIEKKERGQGNAGKSKGLSHLVLGLALSAFVLGTAVTLLSGIRPREESGRFAMGSGGEGESPAGNSGTAALPPGVEETEVNQLKEKASKDSNDFASRERLGHIYLQMQDYEKVFQMSHEALQIRPDSFESRIHMGMVLFSMGEIDQSLEQLEIALKGEPNNLEALAFKGLILLQGKNDREGAKKVWARYLKRAKPGDLGWGMVQALSQTP
ncbi:MAG: tetratricopeptide repeat protein [Deltaproteobacteria bacterium]|nr:tetratricopeptide repeat protein [Deltaproteobacteria bacterium]